MPQFPFTASWWRCKKCNYRWPKVDGLHAFSDPVEYLECQKKNCTGSYEDGVSERGRSTCYWLWECSCSWFVSWKDDWCHNPDCGKSWLLQQAPPRRIPGKGPTVAKNKFKKKSEEEIKEIEEKIENNEPHEPIDNCPERCGLRHLFELELEAPKLNGCVKEPYEVWAQLDPMLDPAWGRKGTMTWTVTAGRDVALFDGRHNQFAGSGQDTQAYLEAVAEDGESKFKGGGVTVQCVFNFGGPRDVDISARKRFSFHEGVTADCPSNCPEIPPADTEIAIKAIGTDWGAREIDEDILLCPGEDVVLAVELTPPLPSASLRWKLTEDKGHEFLGGLFSDSLVSECDVDEHTRLRHAPGTWEGPSRTEMQSLVGPIPVNAEVTYRVEPVKLTLEIEVGDEVLTKEVELRWHPVKLTLGALVGSQEGHTHGGQVSLRGVASQGAYAGTARSHQQKTPDAKGLSSDHAWVGRVLAFVGQPVGDCVMNSNCLNGRWGAGFCQARLRSNRWWRYFDDAEGGHKKWLKTVDETPGLRRVAEAAVPAPWHSFPVTLKTRTSTAKDAPFTSDQGEVCGGSPWAKAEWTRSRGGHDYDLNRATIESDCQTLLAVGLYDRDQGAWRDTYDLVSVAWSFSLVVDVERPFSSRVLSKVSLGHSAGHKHSAADLVGRSAVGVELAEYLSQAEPVNGDPVPQDAPGVKVLELRLKGGGKESALHTQELSLDPDNKFHFAPGFDRVDLCYTLEDPEEQLPPAFLELYRKDKDDAPVWSRELTLDERRPGAHVIKWEGKLSGVSPTLFPSGYATLEHSPYKLRLVYPGSTSESPDAWTFFEVLPHSVEIGLLPRKAAPETLWWDYLDGRGVPGPGGKQRLFMGGNVYDQGKGKYNDSFYSSHKKLWGDGETIPLQVALLLKSCDDSMGGVESGVGVGAAKFVWSYSWFSDPDGHLSNYSDDVSGHAAAYVERVRATHENETKPSGKNAHFLGGGKRGSDTARVLLEKKGYGPTDSLIPSKWPFTCKRLPTRTWAVVSDGWASGTFAGKSGVLFQPSRMGGDAYTLEVHYVGAGKTLSDFDGQGVLSSPISADTGAFVVWRSVTIARYERKYESVKKMDWAGIAEHFKYGYVKVVRPSKEEIMGRSEYNTRIELATEKLSKRERAAVSLADQYLAGDHAVEFRSHSSWEIAYSEALGIAAGAVKLVGGYLEEGEEYESFCYNLAKKVIHKGWGDYLTRRGMTVLQWNESNLIGTGLLGRAPGKSDIPSMTYNRALYLMFDDDSNNTAVDTAVHEIGHFMFLAHSDGRTPGPTPSVYHDDVNDDLCMMTYSSRSDVHLCGACLMRLRGYEGGYLVLRKFG